MANSSSEWSSNGRPVSTIALSFSAALDDIFNLDSSSDLARSVEQRKHEIESSERQLQDLESRLRKADEQLKRLESRHRRMQSESVLPFRSRARNPYNSSDSEGHSSSASDSERR